MTNVSAGFRPPCWCPSRWAPAWRLHTNLYKFGENVSPHIFHKKHCCDLNLGQSLCISTFFLFPDSELNLLDGFDFLLWSILNGVTLKTSNLISLWIMSTTQRYCRVGSSFTCVIIPLIISNKIRLPHNIILICVNESNILPIQSDSVFSVGLSSSEIVARHR